VVKIELSNEFEEKEFVIDRIKSFLCINEDCSNPCSRFVNVGVDVLQKERDCSVTGAIFSKTMLIITEEIVHNFCQTAKKHLFKNFG